ncbi:hypothetical protein [Halobacillus sp. A5]|uniref:hypothetical protein n=1 Tax=Halobacillus sp. A5 TaxID=2880263 RepID=UPI0020A680E9|nr:hypothetical protein [Halobacillus sp. A5]MCP3026331.1 hypothetical protein [Halobacillus sp. A5]
MMAEVYDFEQFKSKKEMKRVTQENIVYEIYLSTVKYVRQYSSADPVGHITTDLSLYRLFEGDRQLFHKAFKDLTDYWKIEVDSNIDYTAGKEFEAFPTVGHLCTFIEGRIKGNDA